MPSGDSVNSVLIVEDDFHTRQRLVDLIDVHENFEVTHAVGTYQHGKEALDSQPDIALIDLGLPDGNGIGLIKHIFNSDFKTECMVITVFGDDGHVVRALEAGATGYILKDDNQTNIIESLKNLLQGGSPISPMIARKLLHRFKPPEIKQSDNMILTNREMDVLKVMARGYTFNEASESLNISYHTVVGHVKHIYKKLAVNSRSEAVYEAEQLGIIQLRERG